jgi:CAAX prenyl protease-like protein
VTPSSTVSYTAPFAVYIGFLALHSVLPLPPRVDEPLRLIVLALVIWLVSWRVVDLRVAHWMGSLALGVAIFFLWILPDALFPGYRQSVIFQNALTGKMASSLPPGAIMDPLVLILRTVRSFALVPILEELFWRGWLMRWVINPDFEKVPLGTYARGAFWIVAFLFAAEHGPYWDVGLAAGILFNYWMVRTRSLGDLIFAHAVANLSLSAYVIAAGKWEYWL